MTVRSRGFHSAHAAAQILFEETLYQDGSDGTPLVQVLQRQGIVPGARCRRLSQLCLASSPRMTRQVKRRTRGREKGALTRLPTVPVLSSAARMPLPGEVIFFAVAISSSLYLLSAALPHILAMAASLAVQEQLL